MRYHVQLYTHRRRLSGQPGHVPPIIEKRVAFITFYHRLPPIFLTSLRQCVGLHVTLRAGLNHITFGNCIYFDFAPAVPRYFLFCCLRIGCSRPLLHMDTSSAAYRFPQVFKLGPTCEWKDLASTRLLHGLTDLWAK